MHTEIYTQMEVQLGQSRSQWTLNDPSQLLESHGQDSTLQKQSRNRVETECRPSADKAVNDNNVRVEISVWSLQTKAIALALTLFEQNNNDKVRHFEKAHTYAIPKRRAAPLSRRKRRWESLPTVSDCKNPHWSSDTRPAASACAAPATPPLYTNLTRHKSSNTIPKPRIRNYIKRSSRTSQWPSSPSFHETTQLINHPAPRKP